MIWIICFFAALGVLVLTVALAASRKRGKPVSAVRTTDVRFAGVAIAALIVLIPIYETKGFRGGFFTSFLLALHHMLRMFVIDGELTFVAEGLGGIPDWLAVPYFVLSAALFAAAPLITFEFVLSFSKRATAARRFLSRFGADMFVFSHINEKTAALGESLAANHPNSLFVYCGDRNDVPNALSERVAAIGAVTFKKDVTALRLQLHSKKSRMVLFVIGDAQAENVDTAYALAQKYGSRSDTDLYVASAEPKAEALLARFSDCRMRLHRISEVRSDLYHALYSNGERLFLDAVPVEGEKQIRAAIVGLGPYGREALKALPWFCQMDGYRVYIHAFDSDPNAAGRFYAACPELMDNAHNGNFTDDGEARYRIELTGGVDVQTEAFLNAVKDLGTVTFTLIDTGDDERNVRLAIRLRVLYERMRIHPRIVAVLHNPDEREVLSGVTDSFGNPYEIAFMGDTRSCYTEDVILHSALEREALEMHRKWGEERTFRIYEYNYRSSMAAAIHAKMRRLCNIPGADRPASERSDADRLRIRKLEHRRWNAYMRAEGYVYSGSPEPSSRNDLGKMHNCLTSYDQLSEADRNKDDA